MWHIRRINISGDQLYDAHAGQQWILMPTGSREMVMPSWNMKQSPTKDTYSFYVGSRVYK